MVRFHIVAALASGALMAGCSPQVASASGLQGRVIGYTWKVDPVSGITGGRDLYSVSLNAKGDVGFAVGGEGLVVRWNGRDWVPDTDAMALAKGELLHAVAVDSAGKRALAVGDNGLIMSWNGKAWKHEGSAEKLAKNRSLFAIDFDDQGRTAWVVGQYGMALHWNGIRWKRTPTPFKVPGFVSGGAPVDIFGMWSVWIEPNGIDAVATGNGNLILRWDGHHWKDDKRFPDLRSRGDAFFGMRSIAVSKDGKKGWMVGTGSTTLTRSSSKWQKLPPAGNPDDNPGLFSVACDGTGSNVYALGEGGTIKRWDGTRWLVDPSGSNAAESRSLMGLALSESGKVGFAVGLRGTILRWDGTDWKRDPMGERASYGEFSSVGTGEDGTSGLAVCYTGTPLHWNGKSWSADGSGRPRDLRLNVLWMNPAGNRAFGAGEDGVFEWNGSKWTAQASSRSIHAMAFTEDARLGFTGNIAGKIYRYDGSQWAEDKQGSQEAGDKALWAMYLSPDGSLGFAGGSDTFLQWDGSTWRKDPKLSMWSSFYAICLSKRQNLGFAIGQSRNGETVVRWNGKDWSIDAQASKVFRDSGPYDIALSEDGQTGIAASFQGSVFYWDGKKWSRDATASNLMQGQRPVSISLDRTGRSGWVLGWKGFLARFEAVTATGGSGKHSAAE